MKLQKIILKHFQKYPTYKGLLYIYSIGSLIGLLIIIQIITGLILTFYYIPQVGLAFESIELITNVFHGGWFLRFIHMNIASILFMAIYLHMIRSLFLGLYKKENKSTWFTGYLLYILLVVVSFLGYVLPWGQMSFWRATIITNLIAVVPWGERLVQLIWGDVSVSHITLKRFFTLHYILPLFLSVIIIIHIHYLHEINTTDSSNKSNIIKIKQSELGQYFLIKDLMLLFLIMGILIVIICFYPYFFANPVNEIKANFMVAPEHILPEWYFLPFYGILKFIPNKLMGISLMFLFILAPIILPYTINLNFKNLEQNMVKMINQIIQKIKFIYIVMTYIFFAISACSTIFNVEQCSIILIFYFIIIIIPTIKKN